MIGTLIKLVIILGIAWLIALAAGVRFQGKNIPAYFRAFHLTGTYQVELTNGSTMGSSSVEEIANTVRISTEDGSIVSFSQSEVLHIKKQGIAQAVGSGFKNLAAIYKIRPLFTVKKKDNLVAAFNHWIMEPSRTAEGMKKKNPSIFKSL